jgi:hypothetical protein
VLDESVGGFLEQLEFVDGQVILREEPARALAVPR